MFNETSYHQSNELDGPAGKAARKAAEAAAAAPGQYTGTPGQAPAPAPAPAPASSGFLEFLNSLSMPVKMAGLAILGIVLVKKR